jgi:hypothetical protein
MSGVYQLAYKDISDYLMEIYPFSNNHETYIVTPRYLFNKKNRYLNKKLGLNKVNYFGNKMSRNTNLKTTTMTPNKFNKSIRHQMLQMVIEDFNQSKKFNYTTGWLEKNNCSYAFSVQPFLKQNGYMDENKNLLKPIVFPILLDGLRKRSKIWQREHAERVKHRNNILDYSRIPDMKESDNDLIHRFKLLIQEIRNRGIQVEVKIMQVTNL